MPEGTGLGGIAGGLVGRIIAATVQRSCGRDIRVADDDKIGVDAVDGEVVHDCDSRVPVELLHVDSITVGANKLIPGPQFACVDPAAIRDPERVPLRGRNPVNVTIGIRISTHLNEVLDPVTDDETRHHLGSRFPGHRVSGEYQVANLNIWIGLLDPSAIRTSVPGTKLLCVTQFVTFRITGFRATAWVTGRTTRAAVEVTRATVVTARTTIVAPRIASPAAVPTPGTNINAIETTSSAASQKFGSSNHSSPSKSRPLIGSCG